MNIQFAKILPVKSIAESLECIVEHDIDFRYYSSMY